MRFFYGWFLVAVAWVNYSFGISPGYYSWGFFSPDIINDLELTRAQTGAVFGVFTFMYSGIGPIAGMASPAGARARRWWSAARSRHLGARLVKENIILNAIAPGPFPTWMLSTGVGGGGEIEGVDWDEVGKKNPRGRLGTAEDIAGFAIFLSSRAGAFTVGETITCDSGSVACS